jgi:HEAT repeat protein
MRKAFLALVLAAQAFPPAFAQADDKAAIDDAIQRWKKAYVNPSATARATAVLELSRTPHDQTLTRILPLLVSDDSAVRAAAAKALANYGDWKKVVTPSLTSALQSNVKDYPVQKAIFETLGQVADPVSLPTVHANFRQADARVAKAAIACAGAMRQKESMDALLDLQKDIQKWMKIHQSGPYRDERGQKGEEDAWANRLSDLQGAIIQAFQGITQERWSTVAEWEIWWNRKKATFEIPK